MASHPSSQASQLNKATTRLVWAPRALGQRTRQIQVPTDSGADIGGFDSILAFLNGLTGYTSAAGV